MPFIRKFYKGDIVCLKSAHYYDYPDKYLIIDTQFDLFINRYIIERIDGTEFTMPFMDEKLLYLKNDIFREYTLWDKLIRCLF